MHNSNEIIWEKEDIPDSDYLYYRIHQNNLRNNKITPGVFKEVGEGDERGMSTDWSRYSTPEESLKRAKIPAHNGIIHFVVKSIRTIPLEILHSPIKRKSITAYCQQ